MHGRSGDESIIHALDIQTVADRMIADGRMKPMLIVCPRMEDALGLGAFEDYFFNEVMPIVEKQYKTSVRRIGGVSAGGFIALNYAFRHPYLFERVGGHMPAIEDVLDDDDLHYFGTSEQWKANNWFRSVLCLQLWRFILTQEVRTKVDFIEDVRNWQKDWQSVAFWFRII